MNLPIVIEISARLGHSECWETLAFSLAPGWYQFLFMSDSYQYDRSELGGRSLSDPSASTAYSTK